MLKLTVITPTIGNKHLAEAIRSVQNQSYETIKHTLVVDGQANLPAVKKIADETKFKGEILVLPTATGLNKFFGHRIYGAMPLLLDSDLVAFLDEDNWYEANHAASAVTMIEEGHLSWAYALRNVVESDSTFICRDDCQSLGWWPAYDGAYHHVDTSCFIVRREVAVAAASLWHRQGYTPGVRDPDREFCRWLIYNHPHGFTTGQYTVNYRLGSNHTEDRDRTFYQFGNAISGKMYNVFPWLVVGAQKPDGDRCHLGFIPKTEDVAAVFGQIPATLNRSH